MIAEFSNRISLEEYLAIPCDSRSSIVDFLDSPELYAGRHVFGTIKPKTETPDMEFGAMVDAFITDDVEPSVSPPENVVVIPGDVLGKNGAKNTKAYREWAADQDPDSLLWKQKELDSYLEEQEANRAVCYKIRDAITNHRMARKLLLDRERITQVTLQFECEGLPVKARPDVVPQRLHAIADLKVSADTNPKFFCNRAKENGYDIQGFLCRIGWKLASGEEDFRQFVNVVVARTDPYQVRCYELSRDFLERGAFLATQAIQGIKRCQATDSWYPKDHGDVITLDPPRYMRVQPLNFDE